jgi:hypothetical protein
LGAWDRSPWDNDSAADWFGDLFDTIPLAQKVEETLNLEPQEHHEEIRAAAAILIMLGRRYIWPISELDRHLQLAISRLEQLREIYIGLGGAAWGEALDDEIAVLQSRLAYAPESQATQPRGWEKFWR